MDAGCGQGKCGQIVAQYQSDDVPGVRSSACCNNGTLHCKKIELNSKVLENKRFAPHPELMREVRAVFLILLFTSCCALSAPVDPQQQLVDAFALQRAAQSSKAITNAKTLIASGVLDELGTGRAWILLGLCYEDQGKFADAQRAYEQAIRILITQPQWKKDYASALDDLGHLYRTMGQWQAATDLRLKAIRVFEENSDHGGLARAYTSLSAVDLDQKHMRECRKHLKTAFEELNRSTDVDDDDRAAAYSIQAGLALHDQDVSQALAEYQHALELWRRNHGENHPLTGWGYILLGSAESEDGEPSKAEEVMQEGMAILDRTLGSGNPRYLEAEIAYARVLDQAGQHSRAARLKADADQSLKELSKSQCIGCTISAAALK